MTGKPYGATVAIMLIGLCAIAILILGCIELRVRLRGRKVEFVQHPRTRLVCIILL